MAIQKKSNSGDLRQRHQELERLVDQMRDFVAQCDVTIKHAYDDVELDIFRSSMGASGQRIPDE